jgi:hypothetical protein
MTKPRPLANLGKPTRDRLLERLKALRSDEEPTAAAAGGHQRLAARVAALEDAVEENRRLNQRLADVIDVVTEVLVPAVDRDDERLRQALGNLGRTLDADRSDRSDQSEPGDTDTQDTDTGRAVTQHADTPPSGHPE